MNLLKANNNRYEGDWKRDKKNGPGRFFFLNKGQLLDGFWIEDINKTGKFIDLDREAAPEPTKYELPEVKSDASLLIFNHLYWVNIFASTDSAQGLGASFAEFYRDI